MDLLAVDAKYVGETQRKNIVFVFKTRVGGE